MKLIIFDCDGTLIDGQHIIVEAMQAAFLASGFAAPDRSHVLRHVGLSISEAMTAMVPGADAKAVARLGDEYRKAFSALRQEDRIAEPMYPGAREAILALAARDDVLLGIATGKSRRGVDRMIVREGFDGLFATIMTADDAPSKPHPAMILQAMDETGATAADSVMVGDTSFDMLMARAARVAAIGVAWGYHDPAELIEAGAATVARDFPQLQALLTPGRDVIAA